VSLARALERRSTALRLEKSAAEVIRQVDKKVTKGRSHGLASYLQTVSGRGTGRTSEFVFHPTQEVRYYEDVTQPVVTERTGSSTTSLPQYTTDLRIGAIQASDVPVGLRGKIGVPNTASGALVYVGGRGTAGSARRLAPRWTRDFLMKSAAS
jgi:hypothetical protein